MWQPMANAPISIVQISFLLSLDRSKHAGIFPCSLFSILDYGGSRVCYMEQLVQ